MTARSAGPPVDPDAPNDPAVEAAFRAAPDDVVAEILDGELRTLPRPARPHTRVGSSLAFAIGGPFDAGRGGPGGWVILIEPEIHLGPKPDKVVPDLAGWRRERMPDAIGSENAPAHYDLAPDWICEILSSRTEAVDRGSKMRIYRREGVASVWLVNPLLHTVEVYRLSNKQWMLVDTLEGDRAVRAEPFDAIELDLGQLFSK